MMSPEELTRALVEKEKVAPLAAAGWEREGAREIGGARGVFFDLASVTKPMTALAFARSGVDRRAPLGDLVVEARGTASEGVPVELFLAHRAGLDAHRKVYAPLLAADGRPMDVAAALHEAADARRPELTGEAPPEGFPPVYSDLGYVLAGVALARAVGARDAGEAVARLVLEPLGLGAQAGTVRELAARGVTGPFAPTETVDWRGGPVEGAVHDENAWALTGLGGSGHAGIFGTADAVLTFGRAVLDALDRDPALAWLVRERPGGTLRAGFDGKSPPPETSSAGERMGPRAFGHLGFTGTSLWIDPDARVVVTLLTNRVCPTRDHLAIRAVRPWAHDRLYERAEAMTAGPGKRERDRFT
ncbi:MAG TPA: serine hydrolase domain-containing protein [Polyangiaceae bacterium]|jgi:CubicO group peptidase (beta-lactamase class C family)|nr:serine hydrolase domain-containing protein [Polyangiaceae bacterium]